MENIIISRLPLLENLHPCEFRQSLTEISKLSDLTTQNSEFICEMSKFLNITAKKLNLHSTISRTRCFDGCEVFLPSSLSSLTTTMIPCKGAATTTTNTMITTTTTTTMITIPCKDAFPHTKPGQSQHRSYPTCSRWCLLQLATLTTFSLRLMMMILQRYGIRAYLTKLMMPSTTGYFGKKQLWSVQAKSIDVVSRWCSLIFIINLKNKSTDIVSRIDVLNVCYETSRFLFPIGFATFTMIYWTYYLNQRQHWE